jgi:hypothetical protein
VRQPHPVSLSVDSLVYLSKARQATISADHHKRIYSRETHFESREAPPQHRRRPWRLNGLMNDDAPQTPQRDPHADR